MENLLFKIIVFITIYCFILFITCDCSSHTRWVKQNYEKQLQETRVAENERNKASSSEKKEREKTKSSKEKEREKTKSSKEKEEKKNMSPDPQDAFWLGGENEDNRNYFGTSSSKNYEEYFPMKRIEEHVPIRYGTSKPYEFVEPMYWNWLTSTHKLRIYDKTYKCQVGGNRKNSHGKNEFVACGEWASYYQKLKNYTVSPKEDCEAFAREFVHRFDCNGNIFCKKRGI